MHLSSSLVNVTISVNFSCPMDFLFDLLDHDSLSLQQKKFLKDFTERILFIILFTADLGDLLKGVSFCFVFIKAVEDQDPLM